MCFWHHFDFHVNVRVAVNVKSNMTVTHIRFKNKAASAAAAAGCNAKNFYTKQQLSRRLKHMNQTFSGGISMLLLINTLFLLLLSFCCDVCCQTNGFMPSHERETTPMRNFNEKNINHQNSTHLTILNNNNNNNAKPETGFHQHQHHHHHYSNIDDIVYHANIATNSDGDSDVNSDSDSNSSSNIDDIAIDGAHTDMTIVIVTRDCWQRCIAEENVYLDEFGIKCADGDTGEKCFRSRCTKGCEQWWRALKEFDACEEACASTQFYPYDLPCISACEMAQRQYWHLQRLSLESLIRTTAPQLLNNSLTANSLILQWPIIFPENYLPSRPFNIQFQYVVHDEEADNNKDARDKELEDYDYDDSMSAEQHTIATTNTSNTIVSLPQQHWSNLADYNCNENFECEIVEGLMPFTSYRFRFELPFGESSADLLYSPASTVYKTLPSGAPISPPSITNVLALDHSHLAVFWQPGQFINGPLINYKITLETHDANKLREQLLPPEQQHFIFDKLQAATNYTIRLQMLNAEDAGPAAISHISTKYLLRSSYALEDFNLLLIAGEYSIKLKNLEPLADTKVLYQSEQLISDYDIYMAEQRLFIVDVTGSIYSLTLDNADQLSSITVHKNLLNLRAFKLAVDWLNQKLFIAGETPGRTWSIISTDFNGGNENLLTTELTESIQQLSIDPINGWLFWRHAGGMMRMNLATNSVEFILQSTSIGYFNNDYERYLLVAYNKSDNELYELSYDGVYVQKLQLNATATTTHNTALLQGEMQSFLQHANNILATNGTHLMRQNYQTNENDIWPIRDLEWCWNVRPLQRQLVQPMPKAAQQQRPTNLQALLTANMAKITWSAPARTNFQTEYAWQQWEYELEIMDVASNSAFNIRNIKTTYFIVEKLQANNLYKLRVRCASATGVVAGENGGAASITRLPRGVAFGIDNGAGSIAAALASTSRSVSAQWSKELLTRTWPLGEHKFMWATQQGLYETNELGTATKRVGQVENVRDFVQLNGTIFYINAANRLQCANIMNPEVNCSFTATHANSLAYDWRGGKIYWTDEQRNLVLRANLDGSERELLQIFNARDIEIDAYMGHMYYSTGTRLARRTLSGTFDTEELEYFHVNGFGGVIRSFALNLPQQYLYWIVRQNEGHVRLFMASLDKSQYKLQEQMLLEQDIVAGSLRYLSDIESLMWLPVNSSVALMTRTSLTAESNAIVEMPASWARELHSVQMKLEFTPYMDVSVIPDAVNVSSIRIDDGYWDDFNIKWTSITTAENYTVFYKVLLQYGNDLGKLRFYTMEVTEPFIRITEFHQPLLLLNVTITPHTYWHAGPSVSSSLRTPAAAPTQPKRLRIFVERLEQALQEQPNISALIRWDPPENVSLTSGISYKIFSWLGEELFAEAFHNFSSADKPLEAAIGGLRIGETYTFQVQAFAAGRSSGGEKTAFHALHINPEIQAVPRLLYTTSDYIAELDLDLNTRRILVHTTSEVEHLQTIQGEQRLLWVNENVELISFVPGSTPVKLARMRAEVLSLTVDWIARIIYWAEMANDVENAVAVYKLSLNQFEGRVMLGTKLFTTAAGHLLRDLTVLPYAQSLVWLDYELGATNASLTGRNLSDFSELKFKHMVLVRLFEGSPLAEAETVNLVDFKGKICAYDVQRHICTPLKMHFNVVTDGIAELGRDAGYIYALKNDSIRSYNRRKQNLEYLIDVFDVKKIKAYNQQPYPQRKCLLPEFEEKLREEQRLSVQAVVLEEQYITLKLPQLNTHDECWLPLPGLKYMLTLTEPTRNMSRNFTAYEQVLNITQLRPFTNYNIQLKGSSYYQQKLGLPQLEAQTLNVRTAAGTPTDPQNFSAYALSPSEIEVSWSAPLQWHCDRIWYQLHWQLDNTTQGSHKVLNETSFTLTNLEPNSEYTIWLNVYSSENKFNTSKFVNVQTYANPHALLLVERSAYNLTLSWQATQNLSNIVLVCHDLGGETDFSIDLSSHSTDSSIVVPELEPKTKYAFYFTLSYMGVKRPYNWPELYNEHFVFETLGDSPSSPGQPQIELITGEIFKVFWEPARNNGAPILEYSLEALQARLRKRKRRDTIELQQTTESPVLPTNSGTFTLFKNQTISLLSNLPWAEEPHPIEDKWIVYCNTTELSCIVRDLHTQHLLMFRVRARNAPYGWGPYSLDSVRVSEPFVSPEKRNSLVLAIIAPAAIVSSCVIALVIIRLIQKRRSKAKKLLEKSRPSIWSNFSTLQQQQLMASRNRTFSVASHSTLYTGGPLSDADIALLPHINWSQVTLLNFLGSGAFGEVHEGLIKHEDEDEPEKVAIKSLRKGASEFAELLQEAQLMSNFKHENIVRLIGVCFDTESISLIMEHMEGGDLLSYLRESRPNSNKPLASLQLLDLMTMCIDVATGCSYLEDMHFVHRDLACRNCLVSSRIPSKRVVKIGDFGLARDIYKSDYYRKEGEGLLPVRWMSPESLVDGVFTTQSDVWAFAVLCWEILTLGQQPYVARNNFEVLNFVKEGGRLEQPDNCPDKFYTLLLQCWQTDADERPSFRKCLNMLLNIKTDVRRVSLGYNMDDHDYAMYANGSGVVMSTFLANPNPLPKVIEEDDQTAAAEELNSKTVALSVNEKSDLKVRFENLSSDIEIDSASDASQLIENDKHKDEKNTNFYTNEAVSRL